MTSHRRPAGNAGAIKLIGSGVRRVEDAQRRYPIAVVNLDEEPGVRIEGTQASTLRGGGQDRVVGSSLSPVSLHAGSAVGGRWMVTDVRCALARGHGLCPESMVSGWDNGAACALHTLILSVVLYGDLPNHK
jgi:hypothetical protein